jgi:hypothetical protein
LKHFLRIILLFLFLNISGVAIAFFIPGRLAYVDSYALSLEKAVIGLMEKKAAKSAQQGDHPDPFKAHTVSFFELTPYLDELNPGSLFFSDQGGAVSARFVEGRWKHCGIYMGTMGQIKAYWGEEHALVQSLLAYYTSEDEYLIFDSSYEYGVAMHSIREMAGLSDNSNLRTLLLYEYGLNKEEWSQQLLSGLKHLGKEYDYFFVLDKDDALYCSEFLYHLLPLEQSHFIPSRKILGRSFLLPLDLLQAISDKGTASDNFIYKGAISKQ